MYDTTCICIILYKFKLTGNNGELFKSSPNIQPTALPKQTYQIIKTSTMAMLHNTNKYMYIFTRYVPDLTIQALLVLFNNINNTVSFIYLFVFSSSL